MEEMEKTKRMSREKINDIAQKLGVTLDKTRKIIAEKEEISLYELMEIEAFKEMFFPDISLCELMAPSKNPYL
jgi:hypothetical protein